MIGTSGFFLGTFKKHKVLPYFLCIIYVIILKLPGFITPMDSGKHRVVAQVIKSVPYILKGCTYQGT